MPRDRNTKHCKAELWGKACALGPEKLAFGVLKEDTFIQQLTCQHMKALARYCNMQSTLKNSQRPNCHSQGTSCHMLWLLLTDTGPANDNRLMKTLSKVITCQVTSSYSHFRVKSHSTEPASVTSETVPQHWFCHLTQHKVQL